MGNLEYENMEIGKEQPPVVAKPVIVESYSEVDVKKGDKDIGKKLVFKVKHPDVPEMEISKVKYEKNKKLSEAGIWLQKDVDGNIPFNSALSALLRHYNCSKIADMKGKTIETTQDENGFLIAKAY